MLQEIITYLIIAAAVILTVSKIIKRFGGSKKKPKSGHPAATVTHIHNCGECAANDCQLRDLPKVAIQKNPDACVPVKKESNSL